MISLEPQINNAVAKVENAVRWYDGFHAADAVHTAKIIYQENRFYTEGEGKKAIEVFGRVINQGFSFTTSGYVKKLAKSVQREITNQPSELSIYQQEQFATHLVKYFTDFTNYLVYLANPSTRNAKDNPDKERAVAAMRRRKYLMILGVVVSISGVVWLGQTLYG